MPNAIRTIYCYVTTMVVQFIEDGCMTRAAALAFTSLLSLVPLITVSLLVVRAFHFFQGLSQKVQDFIFANFVAGQSDVVQHHIQRFVDQAAQLSAPGFLFLIITAVLMVFNLERAFNAVWHVKERRAWVPSFLMYWAVLTLLPILIGIGVTVSYRIFTASVVSEAASKLGIYHLIVSMIPVALTFIAFTILYVAVPNTKVPLLKAAAGSCVATILFRLARFGFAVYLKLSPTYVFLYGAALAAIPIFLVWVYVCWLVVLAGAVISYVLTTGPEADTAQT